MLLEHLVLFLGVICSINAVKILTESGLQGIIRPPVSPQNAGTATSVNITDRIVGSSPDFIIDHLYVTAFYGFDVDDINTFGAVINEYWAVSPAYPIASYADPANIANLFLFIGLNNLWNANNNEQLYRSVQEIVFYTDAQVGIKNNIALTRFCPSVSSDYWAPLAQPGTMYTQGQIATLYTYQTGSRDFASGSKPVGENCECDQVPNWDPMQHICLMEDYTVYGDGVSDYFALPTEIDGDLAGFLLWYQDYSGEVVINLASFYPWLADSTPVAPYYY